MPSPSSLEPADEYRHRAAACRATLSRLDRASLLLSNLRLAFFVFALAVALLAWFGKLPPAAGWGALLLALAFLAAAVAHDRVLGRERRERHRLAINERGTDRIEQHWDRLSGGAERYLEAEHPYARDLDLFGRNSLFQLLDSSATRWGEERLASWLLSAATVEEIAARQQAARELAGRLDFREGLEVEGRMLSETKPDPGRLIAWAEQPPSRSLVRWGWLPFALPPLTAALYLASHFALLPWRLWALGLAAQVVVAAISSRTAGRLFAEAQAPGERFVSFRDVFSVIEKTSFEAAPLRQLHEQLRATGAAPSVEMGRLTRALSFLQLREQPLFHIPLNALVLWDLGWATALERWRGRCGPRLRGWLEALARMEALSSLAGFAFDNPDYCWPEVSLGEARLRAEGLGHPLLPAGRRICNDVDLPGPGSALLVTGSNMAGKTTLLRTLGCNAVLALAGAPVCARRFGVSALEIHTSMRVQDSLAAGLSLFHAEVRRLKSVLDACDRGPVLFLLDEVLQGTNTAERQFASRAIVRRLVERGAIGAIATHDLGLTTLEAETGGRVRNAHFTDRLEAGEMFFDYVLRPGVVATTNALAVLRMAGIDLPEAQPAAHPASASATGREPG